MPYNTNFTWVEKELLKKCKDNYIMIARPREYKFTAAGDDSIRMYFEMISDEPIPIKKCDSPEFIKAPYIAFDSYQYLEVLPDDYDLDNPDIGERQETCEEFYKDKLVVFTPVYKINNEGQSYKNMQIIGIVDDTGGTFTAVPRINIDEKRFEAILKSGEYFTIEGFDNKLISRIDVLICGDYAYRFKHNIEFKSFLVGSDLRDEAWKYNGEQDDDNIVKVKIADLEYFYEDSIEGSDSLLFLEDDLVQQILWSDKAASLNETPVLAENTDEELEAKEGRLQEADDEDQAPSDDEEAKAINASEIAFINGLAELTNRNHLVYDFKDLVNFHTSIKTNPLTIISGMSGTGKTQLAYNYAKMLNLSEDNKTLLFMPISPSYSEPSDILGYLNPMTGEYVPSETGFVDFLIHADTNKDKMHMVIFDEMNLSQVEYWFSPFISILEKDMNERILKLYDPVDGEDKNPNPNRRRYPPTVKINDNVIFVGTVNIDETTKDFSDRLLDRTFVINLKKLDFQTVYDRLKEKEGDKKEYQSIASSNASAFLNWNKKYSSNYLDAFDDHKNEIVFLDALSSLLSSSMHNDGVSHRVIRNIGYFLLNIPEDENGPIIERKEAFDIIVNQTVMQKIRGTEAQLSSLIGNGEEDVPTEKPSLILLLDQFQNVSDFKNVRKAIEKKAEDLRINGYTN